jgi:2-keto-4-pentenoate hydratase/2-oxohepta-3-ene-1,7-dioic acid hydratase in catechol pathway
MSQPYHLLTFQNERGAAVAGIHVNGRVHEASRLLQGIEIPDSASVLGLLGSWMTVKEALSTALKRCGNDDGMPLANVELKAPILYPSGIFATGANYYDHLEEMAEVAFRATGKKSIIHRVAEPYIIMKTSAHSVIGHNADIRYPRFTSQLDWEAEIGVVIGQGGEDISLEKAMEHVAGYTIINDLSARDMMKRDGVPFIFDWFGQKCFAGSVPMGPWITPAEFIEDPYNLGIKLWVNDVIKQDGNSKQMVYSIAEQIAYLSRHLTLRPGDVISTGCPAGVGMPNNDFLKVGDVIRIDVDKIGTLVNRIVDR